MMNKIFLKGRLVLNEIKRNSPPMWIHTGGEHNLTRSAYGLEGSVEGELEASESLDGEVEAPELLGDVLVPVGLAD